MATHLYGRLVAGEQTVEWEVWHFCGLHLVAENHVKEHGEIMTSAAGYHEDVPYCVTEAKPARGEKRDSYGMEQTASEEPIDSVHWNRREQRFRCNQPDPAHRKIRRGREHFEVVKEPELKNDLGHCQGPNQREQRPTPTSSHTYQSERSVSASDKEIDGAMVEDPEGAFGARPGQRVVERRGGVNADQRGSVDRTTHNLQAAATQNGKHQQD